MTDEPRDELDRALGARLGDLSGDAPDADATLAELQPRFRRARTRARVVRASAVALVALVFGVGAFAFAGNAKEKNRVSVAATTTTGSHRSTTSVQRHATTTTAPVPSTTPTTAPTSPRTMITVPFGGNVGPQPTSPEPSIPTTTTIPSQGVNHTYRTDGGAMTVRFANGRLTLISYQAADGWVGSVHTNKPDDIEVRFSKGEEDTGIRVRVENGQVVRVDD